MKPAMKPAMKPLLLIASCCVAFGMTACARKDVEENRLSISRFVTEHLTESLAAVAEVSHGIDQTPAGDFDVAKSETESLAQSDQERFALLKGVDPSRIERLAPVAESEAAVNEAVRAGLSLTDLLILVAIRSPGILAARESWFASVNRFEQADFLESLLGTYRGFVRELDTRVGPQTHRPMASMSQPYPSLIALKGEVVRNEAAMARIEYQMAVRDTLNRAAALYFELQFDFASLDVLDKSRNLHAQRVPIVQAQVESGGASQADLLRAQSQLALLDIQAQNARHKVEETSAELSAILGLPASERWPRPKAADLRDSAPTQTELAELARAGRQELQSAKLEVALARSVLRLAETMTLPRGASPMSQLSNSAGPEAGPNRDMMTAFAGRTSPETRGQEFPANAAYLEELRRRVTEAEARQSQAEADSQAAVAHSHVARENAGREFRAFADFIEPNANQASQGMREAYESGQATFGVFLDAEREHLEAALMREKARREYNLAIIGERAATGRSIADLVIEPTVRPKGSNP